MSYWSTRSSFNQDLTKIRSLHRVELHFKTNPFQKIPYNVQTDDTCTLRCQPKKLPKIRWNDFIGFQAKPLGGDGRSRWHAVYAQRTREMPGMGWLVGGGEVLRGSQCIEKEAITDSTAQGSHKVPCFTALEQDIFYACFRVGIGMMAVISLPVQASNLSQSKSVWLF